MGKGYMYHCSSCGKDYTLFLGVGMGHMHVCRETLAAVRAGKYGEKLKAAAESEQYVLTEAENKLYKCNDCGFWDVLPDASVYGLADKKNGPKIKFGEKTIEEWGEIPYMTDRKDFRLLEEYVPTCSKCGGEMHPKRYTTKLRLRCPECGAPLEMGLDMLMWD